MKQLVIVVALMAIPTVAYAQNGRPYEKPNLGETNIREPPKSPNPNAGSASDYLLIPQEMIGKDRYLRFDMPVREVKIDDPDVLAGEINGNDQYTLILKPRGVGLTRVLVFGSDNSEFATLRRLIYDAQIAVGTRIVTIREKGVREVMDCAPGCYPSPTSKVREPDQIIENRNIVIDGGKR